MIPKGFAPLEFCIQHQKLKHFQMIFHLINYYEDQDH